MISRLEQLVPPSGDDLKPHDFSDKYRYPRWVARNRPGISDDRLEAVCELGYSLRRVGREKGDVRFGLKRNRFVQLLPGKGMDRIAACTGFMVLGIAAWGCFSLLTGIAKPPRGPFVIGWKGRMLGLLAIMSIPASWALGYILLFVATLTGSSLSGELIVIAANAGALITVFAAMHYFSRSWDRME